MDPISLAVGGALLAVGWLLGRIRGQATGASDSDPDACGCSHPLALHDRTSGTCAGQDRREHYMRFGDRNGFEWASCACRQYTGTRPIEELLGQPYLPQPDEG